MLLYCLKLFDEDGATDDSLVVFIRESGIIDADALLSGLIATLGTTLNSVFKSALLAAIEGELDTRSSALQFIRSPDATEDFLTEVVTCVASRDIDERFPQARLHELYAAAFSSRKEAVVASAAKAIHWVHQTMPLRVQSQMPVLVEEIRRSTVPLAVKVCHTLAGMTGKKFCFPPKI